LYQLLINEEKPAIKPQEKIRKSGMEIVRLYKEGLQKTGEFTILQ